MSTNSLLTPCKQGAVLSRYSDSLGTFTLLHGLGNEYELPTPTLSLDGAEEFACPEDDAGAAYDEGPVGEGEGADLEHLAA